MNAGLAIFVKTPRYSPVKTRLAADCGAAYAHGWYRRAAAAVAAVARVAAARHGLTPYWAVAEPEAIASGMWPDLPMIAQGVGTLGERMARVHGTLVETHGAGLLIGADAPQLTADLLGEASAWLMAPEPHLVLGPARDGGFWLFGGNVAPPLELWRLVRYSAADTRRALRAAMESCGHWHLLADLTDVDDARDLAVVLDELQRLPDPQPEQQRLAEWMLEFEELMA